jgi:hypothetical protein
MKQKYLIIKDDEKKQLVIREFAELDKDSFSPLCEETYDVSIIKSSIKKGKEALFSVLRTKNMYPPGFFADKIADAVLEILDSDATQSTELFFNDIELLTKIEETVNDLSPIETESDEIEEMVEDDYDEDFEDKAAIKNLNSPLKVADDDLADIDEDG